MSFALGQPTSVKEQSKFQYIYSSFLDKNELHEKLLSEILEKLSIVTGENLIMPAEVSVSGSEKDGIVSAMQRQLNRMNTTTDRLHSVMHCLKDLF